MQNTRPKAVFYCGTNGAGKSTLRRLNQDDVSVVIDSDRIAAELNPANPRAADMEAGKKALRLFRQAIESRTSFSLESTLAGVSSLKRMQTAKAAGFHIILNYIGLSSPELNVCRVEERVRNGGHRIDPGLIRKRFSESLRNLQTAVGYADECFIFDNTWFEPMLQLWISGMHYLKRERPSEWIQPIEQAILARKLIFEDFLPADEH